MSSYMIRSVPPGLIGRAKAKAREAGETLDAVLIAELEAYADGRARSQQASRGGEARAAALTPEARSAIARKGGLARAAAIAQGLNTQTRKDKP